jgi:hypothetical protein
MERVLGGEGGEDIFLEKKVRFEDYFEELMIWVMGACYKEYLMVNN